MHYSMRLATLLIAALFVGCSEPSHPETPQATEPAETSHSHSHSHDGDDALVWVEQEIEHEGFMIALGHHGKHLHAASLLEPAVSITRDGEDVADAKVFNSLLETDGETVIREVVETTYEPETDDEPAHYAQGKLHLPKGEAKYIVRFRIQLPDVEEEFGRDMTVEVEE